MVISWKLFWSALGAVITAALAVSMILLSVAWITPLTTSAAVRTLITMLVTVPAVGAAGGLFVAGARVVVHRSPMFAPLAPATRATIVRWITAAAAAHAVWVVVFTLRPRLWWAWTVVLVALAALTYWVARGHEYLLTQLAPPPPGRELAPAAGQATKDQPQQVFEAALQRSGHDYLDVLRWVPLGGPDPFGARFTVRVPSRLALARSGEKGKDAAKLSPADAEPIAIALGEVMRTELESDWVRIRKERTAGTYSVVVVTADVMARVYPYTDTLEWTSITQAALVGYELDGRPYELRLDQHGQAIGQSTSGKSSLIHVGFAHLTRCEDAVIWVGGVEKLYDLVAGWIECYEGTDEPLPFDWITFGPVDTLEMLIAAMNIARWRQRQPMSKRQHWPDLVVVVDEASFLLRNQAVRGFYQGVQVTAAYVVAMLMQGAASAGVRVVLATQRSTNDHFGDYGGDTTANVGWSAAFRSKDEGEIGRLMGDYKLPVPRHRGEFWLDDGTGGMPVNLKAPYLQSIDPTKPTLHNGATIADVAWSRRRFRRQLDAGSADAAGSSYQQRPVRMDASLLHYLTGATTLEPQEPSARQAGFDHATREIEALIGTHTPPQATDTGAGGVAGAPVTALADRRTRAERIVEIVGNAEAPMSRADIVAALRQHGDDTASDQVVTNALSRLVADGDLTRTDRGVYTTAS